MNSNINIINNSQNTQNNNNINITSIKQNLPSLDDFLDNTINKYDLLIEILNLKNTYLIKREKSGSVKYDILRIKGNKIFTENFYNFTKTLFNYFKQVIDNYLQISPIFTEYKAEIKDYNTLYNVLKDYYIYNNLVIDESNLIFDIDFIQKEKMKVKEINLDIAGEKILKVVYNSVDFILEDENVDPKKYYRYLRLYKRVFPDFIEYLDFLALNLFDAGKKTSFVYINAPSNWGKSFLMSVFNELGIGLTVLPKSLEKRPSPLTPEMFRNKINLFIDEFKTFKHDYKMMTNTLQLESKNRNEATIPLFLKTLMSAEYSASFEDGVDEQIQNRVIIYKYKKGEVELLKDLLLREKISDKEFMKYIKVFVKRYLTKKINYIRDNIDNINIEDILNELYEKNKLKVENLEVKLLKLFLSEMYDLREKNKDGKYPYEINLDFDNKNQVIFISNNIVRFTQLEKFVENLIKDENKETQKKFEYKMRGEFFKETFEYTTRRAGTNKLKYYKEIDLDYLEKKLEFLENSDKNLDKDEELKQINYLRKENLRLQKQIDKLQNELNEKKEKIKNLENSNKSLQDQIISLQNELNKLYNIINNNSSDNNGYDLLLNEDEIPF